MNTKTQNPTGCQENRKGFQRRTAPIPATRRHETRRVRCTKTRKVIQWGTAGNFRSYPHHDQLQGGVERRSAGATGDARGSAGPAWTEDESRRIRRGPARFRRALSFRSLALAPARWPRHAARRARQGCFGVFAETVPPSCFRARDACRLRLWLTCRPSSPPTRWPRPRHPGASRCRLCPAGTTSRRPRRDHAASACCDATRAASSSRAGRLRPSA